MWRNTALPVRIVFLDGRACLPLLVFVVYWSWATFYIAIGGMAFFTIVSWAGSRSPRSCGWLAAG